MIREHFATRCESSGPLLLVRIAVIIIVMVQIIFSMRVLVLILRQRPARPLLDALGLHSIVQFIIALINIFMQVRFDVLLAIRNSFRNLEAIGALGHAVGVPEVACMNIPSQLFL